QGIGLLLLGKIGLLHGLQNGVPDFQNLAVGIGGHRLHGGFGVALDLGNLALGLGDPVAHAGFVTFDLPVIATLARDVVARALWRDQQAFIRSLALRFGKGVERHVG